MSPETSNVEEAADASAIAACCSRAVVMIEADIALARRKLARARELPPARRRKMAGTARKLAGRPGSAFKVLPGFKERNPGLLARWQEVQTEVDALLAECGVGRQTVDCPPPFRAPCGPGRGTAAALAQKL